MPVLGGSRAVGQWLTGTSAVNPKISLLNGNGPLRACCSIGETGTGLPLMHYFALINTEFQLLLYGAFIRPFSISTQSALFFITLNYLSAESFNISLLNPGHYSGLRHQCRFLGSSVKYSSLVLSRLE